MNRILSLILLTPIAPLVFAWYLQEPGAPWIVWVAALLGSFWIVAVPFRRIARWPTAYSLIVGIAGAGAIIGVDAINQPIDWSLAVALPVALVAALAVGTLGAATRGFSVWGLPALATIVGGAAITAVVAEGLINRYYGEPFVGATFGLLVVALPCTAVSLYLHYGVGIRIDLRAFFHG